MYIRHHYNPAVVKNFLGDEFFGAGRLTLMKERMRTSAKDVQKLFAQAKAAAGNARGGGGGGGAFGGKAAKRHKAKGQWKQQHAGGNYLPPGYDKSERPAGGSGGKLGANTI
jgi:hypothetical protein